MIAQLARSVLVVRQQQQLGGFLFCTRRPMYLSLFVAVLAQALLL